MFLEEIWSALSVTRWQSIASLLRTSGMDEATLTRVVDFLVHWDFAETRKFSKFQVRRKPGAVSPVEVLDVMRPTAICQHPRNPNRRWSAERVTCGACGHRDFHFIEENQVECLRCSEKQWYKIELDNSETMVEAQVQKQNSPLSRSNEPS